MKNSILTILFISLLGFTPLFGQRNSGAIKVKGIVTDDRGNKLPNVLVKTLSDRKTTITDVSGAFEINAQPNDFISVSLDNHESSVVEIKNGSLVNQEVVLHRKGHQIAGKEFVVPFGKKASEAFAGTAIVISSEQIRSFGGNDLRAALKGKIAGLRDMSGRGGSPLLLIDGLPKSFEDVNLREVEEVIYLPDHVSSAIMGPLAVNGVLYVKTRKGKRGTAELEIDYQHSIDRAASSPVFMDAYNYAKAVNEIRINDGMAPLYDQTALDAYQNNSNPVLYPNLNLKETFLNDMRSSDQVGASLVGGFERGDYYLYSGYESVEGLEKVGEKQDLKNFLFNSKVNIHVNDMISAKFGVMGKYRTFRHSTFSEYALMNNINNIAPNAFPLQLGDSVYIASQQFQTNPLAAQKDGGYIKDVYANIIFDASVNLNLDQVAKGLSYSSNLMLGNSSYYSEKLQNQPEIYRIDGFDVSNNVVLGLLNSESFQLRPSNNGVDVSRNYNYFGNISYAKNSGDFNFNADLVHYLYWDELKGTNIDSKYLFYAFSVDNMYKNKYIVDFTLAYNGSQKFSAGKRFAAFPTIGAGWVISRENFLEGSKRINFLKLRASYGVMGKDPDSDYLFQTLWGGGSRSIYYGINNGGQSINGLRQTRTGNPDISWVKISQFSAGADAMLFNNKLSAQLSYFNKKADGYISNLSAEYSAMLGSFSAYLPAQNANKTGFSGIEAGLAYSDRLLGDLHFTIGANYMYYKTKNIIDNSIIYPDEYRNSVGKATDLIWGLETSGLFSDEAEIAESPVQTFGSVEPGDIKYADLNHDNSIDARDISAIGNSTPRHSYGINASLSYNRWSFYVSGYGLAGYDINLNGSRYYQINGYNNFPANISTLPNGNQMPAISLIDNHNNYRNSQYWLTKGDLFRLNNVELAYKLPFSFSSKVNAQFVKLYFRGNNLILFDHIKDLDAEYMSKGISSYPSMTTFSFGATVRF